MTYGTATLNAVIPCFNCQADMETAYGINTCPECGEQEIAGIHNHSHSWA